MIARASPASDPYGGLSGPYLFKELQSPLPSQIPFKHVGTSGPPEKRTLDAPLIQSSSSTDRKKTNAQICYTRIAKKKSLSDTDVGAPQGAVFVSRSFSEYDGTGLNRRSVIYGLESVNKELGAAALPTADAASPLDEWRSVDLLREWTLDGVLLGRPQEVVKSDVLNVCVAGHCPVRNVFDAENVFPMDTCYLCLIAKVEDDGTPDGKFTFQYAPCTSRAFADTRIAGTAYSRKPPTLSDEQRARVVGAWKLGCVVDSAAVKDKYQHSLTVNVSVQWVDWRVLRETFQDAGVASMWLARPGAPVYNPCEIFNWPSFVNATRPRQLEPPSIPHRSNAEIKLDKHVEKQNLERCALVGPPPPPPPLAPPPVVPGGNNAPPPPPSAPGSGGGEGPPPPPSPLAPPRVVPGPGGNNAPPPPSSAPGSGGSEGPPPPPSPLAPSRVVPGPGGKNARPPPPSSPGSGGGGGSPSHRQRKRCRENDLFDPEEPPSPLSPGAMQLAIDEAERVLAKALDARTDWLEYLNTQRGTVAKLDGWVLQLKRDLISYQLRFSKLLQKYEMCAFEDDSGRIPALLEALRSMEEFERGNPLEDTGSSKMLAF